ncbi:MAG: chromosome segregation protein SMC [Deltaproteobacteria bacterium]|nr:chromosome segregation protein SMC [Deltaproteobacteria bacterium]
MKIKKITIHGFKSFVDKVTLNLSSGTSGIIGPNGCGKSNIVDAIRWVLGEQNARHLRGKHMEDIIFYGSDGRKPLGMAEVVLTFSNENGQAGAGFSSFSEIEISRRLYRSGESEYYINKVQCRLRDIVDLFTDTGVGTRAYSIIEQGQVGWLVAAKPEERRAIFEEAAGINKFKHKKDAALRRLAATKENLTRVSDIISEVKRQLNSLNRQAKKAERYKLLKDELRSIDLYLSSLEHNRLKDSIAATATRLEGIKDEDLALQTATIARETLLEEIKTDFLTAENEYKTIRERVFGLEKTIQEAEQASTLARVRTEELKRNEERLGGEIEDLKAGKAAAGAEIEALNASIGEVSSFIEAESARLAENSALLEAAVKELRAKEDELRAERTETLRASTRISDIRHSIQSNIKDEESIRIREARASAEKKEAALALVEKEEPVRLLNERLSGDSQRRQAAGEELSGIRSRIEGLEGERANAAGELKKAKDEHARAAARLSTLEEMERNHESLKGGARSIMLMEGRGGVYGLIADVIETNPGYEKAVEAVLGDRLQYVVVESQKHGVEAIEYLKKNSAGRGSFVPLKEARSASPVPVQAGGFGYGDARDLLSEVRIKEGYGGIINYLLGEVLIVEDLESGLELWGGGVYKTIVTRDGEVIDPQGAITGGAANGKDSGILQRRGEIKSIRELASRLEGIVSGLERSLAGIEAEKDEAEALLEEKREALHRLDLERVNLEGELKRFTDEAARLRSVEQDREREIAEAGQKLAAISVKKAELLREREELEQGLSEREERAARLSDGIAGLASRKEGLQNIVTEIRVSLAQTKERFEALKKQAAEKSGLVRETERRITLKCEEIERGRAEAEQKARETGEIKARLEGLIENVDRVKKEEVTQNELLEGLTSKMREVEGELKGLKSRYSELAELKGELSVEIKEMELSFANLREKMAERYGTDMESFSPEAAGLAKDGGPPDLEALEAKRTELRGKIADLGEVSLSALEEYAELEQRHNFLLEQQADLTASCDSLHAAINRINRTTREKFRATFDEINSQFKVNFPKFFNGGKAELRLTEDSDVLEAGVEIVAQPPGKKLQNITLLSGGEKALTATSLIFSIFLIKPSPFCLLDEVDAPLDDANIDRFNLFVKDMARLSQFILITHNKKTMEMADALHGITMEEPGVSKVISVKF